MTQRISISAFVGFAIVLMLISGNVNARLKVCNKTDLVLLVAVGYNTEENRIASEGWWRIYPGFCEVPVDVSLLSGKYYVHAESNPRSTMPIDAFDWGEGKALCVNLSDFRIPDNKQCDAGSVAVKFNEIDKNWKNDNRVDIVYEKRQYQNETRIKVAGLQRLLSMLGYDVGDIDGMPGKLTFEALNEVGKANKVFGFDFLTMFPLLEALIAERQKLDH